METPLGGKDLTVLLDEKKENLMKSEVHRLLQYFPDGYLMFQGRHHEENCVVGEKVNFDVLLI